MSAQAVGVPLQASGSKRAPLGAAVFAAAEGRGGVNVHTSLGTSAVNPVQVFQGSTLQFLEQRARKLKVNTLIHLVESLGKLGYVQEGVALLSCGRYFNAGKVPEGGGRCLGGVVKLLPIHCDSVFCPECARRRAHPYQQKVWNAIRKDKRGLFFITFTLKSTTHLDRERIDTLIAAFKKLREAKAWEGNIVGGFYSIEATWNEKAGWHPHLHVMVKAGESFLNTKKKFQKIWLAQIKSLWREITGDSYYIHIERVYGIDKKGRKTRRINERAVKELVKYSTKAAEFCARPDLVGEFHDSFKSVRRMQAFGSFYGMGKKAEAEAEEESDSEKKKSVLLPGCICGQCTWGIWNSFARVHITDTELLPDGKRVLSKAYLARADLLADSTFDDGKNNSVAVRAARQVSMYDSAA